MGEIYQDPTSVQSCSGVSRLTKENDREHMIASTAKRSIYLTESMLENATATTITTRNQTSTIDTANQSTPSQEHLQDTQDTQISQYPSPEDTRDPLFDLRGLILSPLLSFASIIPVPIEPHICDEPVCLHCTHQESIVLATKGQQCTCLASPAVTHQTEGCYAMERYLEEDTRERYSLFCVQHHGARLPPDMKNVENEVKVVNGI